MVTGRRRFGRGFVSALSWPAVAVVAACGGKTVRHVAGTGETIWQPVPAACVCDPSAPSDAPCCKASAPLPAAACGATCGNGTVDACPSQERPLRAEDCDGDDLGGDTCESLGYTSGTLACGGTCQFDRSRCNDCVESSEIEACVHPVDFDANTLALAVNADGTQVAYAWTAADGLNPGVYFGLTEPGAQGVVGVPIENEGRLALAATPNGYFVLTGHTDYSNQARAAASSITLVGFDSRGALRGTLPFARRFAGFLVPRRDASPLLVYSGPDPGDDNGFSSVRVELLDEDGSVALAPTVIEPKASDRDRWACGGVFTGDGFLVVVSLGDGQPSDGFRLVDVGLDGSIRHTEDVAVQQPGSCSLAWNGTDVVWVYEGNFTHGVASEPGMRWQRLSNQGVPLSDPVSIGDDGVASGDYRVARFGDESLVLRVPNLGGELPQLSVLRLDADGVPTELAQVLTQVPDISGYDMVASDVGAVIGWVGRAPVGDAEGMNEFGRIAIAHVDP